MSYELRGRCKVDTRADMMLSGATFRLLEKTGQLSDVTGFHPDLLLQLMITVMGQLTFWYSRKVYSLVEVQQLIDESKPAPE